MFMELAGELGTGGRDGLMEKLKVADFSVVVGGAVWVEVELLASLGGGVDEELLKTSIGVA